MGSQAPELLGLLPRNTRPEAQYSNSVDIWAVGCLVFKLLTLDTPFVQSGMGTEASSLCTGVNPAPCTPQIDMSFFQEYCSGSVGLPIERFSSRICDVTADFIKSCLAPNPRSRITSRCALDHKWITDDTWEMRSQLRLLNINLSPDQKRSLIPDGNYDPATTDIPGLIVAAASKGYTSLVETLLDLQYTIPDAGSAAQIELQSAAGAGRFDVVGSLLRRYVRGSLASHDLLAAFQSAAKGGHLNIV